MANNKKGSWMDYINTMQGKSFSPGQLKVDGVDKMLNINHHFAGIFHHTLPMIYLVDYSSGQYLTMSRAVKMLLGYEPENFTDNGLAFTVENYHKADLRVFNEQIFPDRLSFLKNIPAAEHAKSIAWKNHDETLPPHEGAPPRGWEENSFTLRAVWPAKSWPSAPPGAPRPPF